MVTLVTVRHSAFVLRLDLEKEKRQFKTETEKGCQKQISC